MEEFTVDCEKNTFPINDRCGHQADCLKQIMNLLKSPLVLDLTHRFAIRNSLRLQVKWEEAPNVTDTLERVTISHWVKINKTFFNKLCIIFRAPWSWCHIFIRIRETLRPNEPSKYTS